MRTIVLSLLFLATAIALPGAASAIRDLVISGSAVVRPGAELVLQPGSTIRAEAGAVISGWPAPGGGGLSSVARDSTLTGTGTPQDPLGVARPLYAIFEIPLGIMHSGVSDFEIKGSVNNFEGLASQALCYFYGSAYGSLESSHGPIGNTIEVYYTDDLNGEDHAAARKYRRQDRSRSLLEQKVGQIGGVMVVVAVDANIRPDNDNLCFVYQRVGVLMEERWVPILPRWTRSYPHIP
ncbi:MAG: hypothetical protein LBG65_07615 [Puniceicoccales bacterium]|jgi:hypothetical protein|nr:hypothetical protein [Puniceicoccales bacterium]